MQEILWEDIQIGNEFLDGSKVTQIHGVHTIGCIKIKTKTEELILSEDHLLLCDISKLKRNVRKQVLKECSCIKIPLEMDYIIFAPIMLTEEQKEDYINMFIDGKLPEDVSVQELVMKDESKIFDINKKLVWLTTLEIHRIMRANVGKISSGGNTILSSSYDGEREAFCVSTDSGKYVTGESGVIHHNSVTIRNIVFHCLTHGIKIGMVDLKITEFEPYKNCRDVIGVANTVEEAAEILRIARSLMYKRNKELAKAGVVDLIDFKPTKKTDRIAVFGREFKDTDKLTIRENGNEREITFGELETMLKG